MRRNHSYMAGKFEHTVVIFVDSKARDLMGTALIAHHLEKRGIRCQLEPLASWRSCLGAWQPDFILFNHLNAPHLADFSQQCKEWGVLIGVLPNEGIFYVEGTLEYNSKRTRDDVHCDAVFCWNDIHRDSLIARGFCSDPSAVVSVGVPRFDFYRPPWNHFSEKRRRERRRDKPVVLVNTNFQLSHFLDLPRKSADTFFAPWKDEIPIYKDYWEIVESSGRGRERFLDHLRVLIECGKYDLVLRPHPRENRQFYVDWLATLPTELSSRVRLSLNETISEAIMGADLEISCENCTTTMEAWLVGIPTVGLVFEKHPFSYTPEVGSLLPECEDPAELVPMIDEALANPSQPDYAEGRCRHMEKWMYRTDGRASERVADGIAVAISRRKKPRKIQLDLPNRRRALKLRMAHWFDEPSNVTPAHYLRHLFKGEKGTQSVKYRAYLKAVRPSEVTQARELIRSIESEASGANP